MGERQSITNLSTNVEFPAHNTFSMQYDRRMELKREIEFLIDNLLVRVHHID